jgi:RNA polymerase sigma factor (sigma-70 family)
MSSVGSGSSIENLYQRDWSRLVRLAWLLTGSREIAEDIVHDAFLSLAGRPTPPKDASPYLRRIVVNGSHDHHRRAATERRHLQLVTQPAFNPEVDEMWELLSRLPGRQRYALVLRFYADFTIEQIAETMDCPVGTVKSLVHRALTQLRYEASQ